jgi:hypothetical protein
MTPAPTLIEFFQASPERGAILAYVFGGIMNERPVLTFPFPFAGIITSYNAHKSYPAAPGVPFLGNTA